MKKAILITLLGVGISASAFAQQHFTTTTYPQSTQSASDADQNTALQNAQQQAENWANSQCVGNVTNTAVISQNATNLGSADNPNYLAVVTVRATCVFTK